ncbi:hypothetical protein DFO67_108155 [Modicisalibacter xianhensis]|uniref:Transposase n=1 Tax=Modicisalibacter xianhensis TaxID=442341 RepID=A0A4R8FRB1_9GAMM|nr:hypothetical protein [Halomonas xianhensis]TDX29111.1 hypothetical protein DFO67_108155 [Halomonas xianhensis]
MKKKTYHPVHLEHGDHRPATARWGVLIEVKGITASLLGEWFETYAEADARADDLNRQERANMYRLLV